MHSFIAEIADPNSPTKWGAITFGVVVIVYMAFIRPLTSGKKKDPLAKSPASMSLSQQRAVERQMSDLLVELSEMSRQMTAQIDTRAAKLEMLIKEADERLAALKGVGERPMEGVIVERRSSVLPNAIPEVDPRHTQVYTLADEGHDPQAIARQLGRPNGEIELILALRGERN